MQQEQKRSPGAPPKGHTARTKVLSLRMMPEVARWLDKQVKKIGVRSRSDWIEALWRKDTGQE